MDSSNRRQHISNFHVRLMTFHRRVAVMHSDGDRTRRPSRARTSRRRPRQRNPVSNVVYNVVNPGASKRQGRRSHGVSRRRTGSGGVAPYKRGLAPPTLTPLVFAGKG